jgi:hypothetical protein
MLAMIQEQNAMLRPRVGAGQTGLVTLLGGTEPAGESVGDGRLTDGGTTPGGGRLARGRGASASASSLSRRPAFDPGRGPRPREPGRGG